MVIIKSRSSRQDSPAARGLKGQQRSARLHLALECLGLDAVFTRDKLHVILHDGDGRGPGVGVNSARYSAVGLWLTVVPDIPGSPHSVELGLKDPHHPLGPKLMNHINDTSNLKKGEYEKQTN